MLLHKDDPSGASRPTANVHYVHQVHPIDTTSSAAIGGLTSISSASIVTRNARRVSKVWKVLPAQEWLAAANEHENRNYEAGTHRLKGELLVKQDDSNAAEAQSCFERAIEIARGQSAKSWELRATMSVAQVLAKHGRHDEARVTLANIYGWFTEGFDTADLKDVKALLEELNG